MVQPATKAEQDGLGGVLIKPHPDGKPWSKCCIGPADDGLSCQCFMRKPRLNRSRHDGTFYNQMAPLKAENGRFFCDHRRTEDGYHRECAGWYAKIRRPQLEHR